jgi:hypothetical protein
MLNKCPAPESIIAARKNAMVGNAYRWSASYLSHDISPLQLESFFSDRLTRTSSSHSDNRTEQCR